MGFIGLLALFYFLFLFCLIILIKQNINCEINDKTLPYTITYTLINVK